MVRLARFERATFGSGDRRSSPAELQAHALIIFDLSQKSNPQFLLFYAPSLDPEVENRGNQGLI
jgi:hypothetical protein